MRPQQLHDGLGEPAGVAELERMAEVARQLVERLGEALIVARERRRQLPQQRAELARVRERLDASEQQVEVPAGVGSRLMCVT